MSLLDDPSDARSSVAVGAGPLLAGDELAAIAARVAADPPLDRLAAVPARRWALAERGDHHDAWVIAWPAGTGLAMHDHHGLQCGYCTPGILMTMTAYLDEHTAPSEDEVREALSGNLCRCTGYQNIVDAVLTAAMRMRG